MAGKEDIREKQKRVREQGYRAAKEDKLYPYELRTVEGDRWEDAKNYSRQNWKGSEYWRNNLTESAKAKAESKRKLRLPKNRITNADRLLRMK